MMRILILPAILICANPYAALAGVNDLICEETGVAGIVFGQQIEEGRARLVEVASSGVTYYAIAPSINIEPFATLTVGVTPRSRRVFSVSLELHGNGGQLDNVIESYKAALHAAHPEITWNSIDNHHYGEQALNVNVALYRIGDFVDGQATSLLTYDCESRALRSVVFDESR